MKKLIVGLVIAVVAIIAIAILKPWFVLVEGEQAVVLKFGEVVRTVTTAGLKWKTPFVETVTKYPKKVMSWDGTAGDVPEVAAAPGAGVRSVSRPGTRKLPMIDWYASQGVQHCGQSYSQISFCVRTASSLLQMRRRSWPTSRRLPSFRS